VNKKGRVYQVHGNRKNLVVNVDVHMFFGAHVGSGTKTKHLPVLYRYSPGNLSNFTIHALPLLCTAVTEPSPRSCHPAFGHASKSGSGQHAGEVIESCVESVA
jgi:hypothetical protein